MGFQKYDKRNKNQAYQLSIIDYLSSFLQNNNCKMLIVGSEDDEIHASFSLYDIKNVTLKARHIVDALRALVIAVENK